MVRKGIITYLTLFFNKNEAETTEEKGIYKNDIKEKKPEWTEGVWHSSDLTVDYKINLFSNRLRNSYTIHIHNAKIIWWRNVWLLWYSFWDFWLLKRNSETILFGWQGWIHKNNKYTKLTFFYKKTFLNNFLYGLAFFKITITLQHKILYSLLFFPFYH